MIDNSVYTIVSTTDDIACASPEACDAFCGNKAGCSNLAYPLLVLRLLPTGRLSLY